MSWLRVRDKSTRHEYTIDERAFREDRHELVTRRGVRATDLVGRPLPAKHRVPNSSSASAAEASTTPTQEESR